jgi:hypothetical protein
VVDVADLGSGREAEFGECLEVAAEFGVVEDRGVPADIAGVLEAVDPAFGRRGGEVDEAANLASRPAAVLDEQVEDAVVERVKSV